MSNVNFSLQLPNLLSSVMSFIPLTFSSVCLSVPFEPASESFSPTLLSNTISCLCPRRLMVDSEVSDIEYAAENPSLTLPRSLSEDETLHIARTRTKYSDSPPNPSTDIGSSRDKVHEEEQGISVRSKYDQGWRRIVRNFSLSYGKISFLHHETPA